MSQLIDPGLELNQIVFFNHGEQPEVTRRYTERASSVAPDVVKNYANRFLIPIFRQ